MQASHQPKRRRATMSSKLNYHSPIRDPEPPWFCKPGPPTANPYPTLDSPISGSCITDDISDLRYKLKEIETVKLKEIETVMLGPDQTTSISPTTTTTSFNDYHYHNNGNESNENEDWGRIADSISRRDVKQVLISCARAVSENDLMMAHWLIDELRRMVSVSGEPAQRLGAYMLEGLVARLGSSGSIICKEPQLSSSLETLSHTTHVLYELCPYFKFGYMSANGAIAEAMRREDRVHIVDFQIGRGSQWVTLIQAFAGRPGGPPRIRITGVGGGPGMEAVGRRLARLAEAVGVPFEFSAVSGPEKVAVRRGGGGEGEEAVAVNFAFALHRAADESVTVENRRDRLIRLAKGLNPKVLTLVEQESNTNTSAFLPRFGEALGYYSAMFESMDEALPRDHRERIGVEQQCLAREVVNIVACEGVERVERHELLGKWRSRLGMAGFRPSPLSSLVNATIKTLLESYSDKYRLEERDGALYLGWRDRFLVTSSAWRL